MEKKVFALPGFIPHARLDDLMASYASDGIAASECMTYSAGFRAAPAQDPAEQFLVYLQDRVNLPDRYRDPDLKLQKHPAKIGSPSIAQITEMLGGIRWNRALIRQLADRRTLPAQKLGDEAVTLLHDCYRCGCAHLA